VPDYLARGGGSAAGRFGGELVNLLQLAVVPQSKVFFPQVGYRMAIRVANNHTYQHCVALHVHRERGLDVLSGNFLFTRGLVGHSLCAAENPRHQ
jgi:hypothetical protein